MAECVDFTLVNDVPQCTDTLVICEDLGVGTWYFYLMNESTGYIRRFTGTLNGDSNMEIDISAIKLMPECQYKLWVNQSTDTNAFTQRDMTKATVTYTCFVFNVQAIKDTSGYITGLTQEITI